mmetsp:Transcript_9259/g.23785  ORF Transcript_9259/g.23785 Transcript_9259/m.23785 type:complete len:115 (+) Transcript_9259:774-1118(+)
MVASSPSSLSIARAIPGDNAGIKSAWPTATARANSLRDANEEEDDAEEDEYDDDDVDEDDAMLLLMPMDSCLLLIPGKFLDRHLERVGEVRPEHREQTLRGDATRDAIANLEQK